jgi:hypothetical protein
MNVDLEMNKNKMNIETYTLTFGDCGENHRGMQKIGKEIKNGLSLSDMKEAEKYFSDRGAKCEMIELKSLLTDAKYDDDLEVDLEEDVQDAYLLVVRGGVDILLGKDGANKLYKEQEVLEKDSKAFMYGRVVNKKARHNLCFSDFEQKANFEEKKGTVVKFDSVKLLNGIRNRLPIICNREDLKGLQCEGNYYYDISQTYIGFHGDTERKLVIAIRLGADFPLYYQWYIKGKRIGNLYKLILSHGDIYFMSDKAVGYDWKKKNILTLRHAAGLEKNLKKFLEDEKKEEKVEDNEVKDDNNDYSKMKVKDLRELAKEKEIKGYSKMKKDELIEKIKENEN